MSDSQQPLFEVIDASEVPTGRTNTGTRAKKQPKTEPRNQTTWWALTQSLVECTIPGHDEYQDSIISPEKKAYRSKYGKIRMCIQIGELNCCRDCFIGEVDKE